MQVTMSDGLSQSRDVRDDMSKNRGTEFVGRGVASKPARRVAIPQLFGYVSIEFVYVRVQREFLNVLQTIRRV